jgi:hypothetical protein
MNSGVCYAGNFVLMYNYVADFFDKHKLWLYFGEFALVSFWIHLIILFLYKIIVEKQAVKDISNLKGDARRIFSSAVLVLLGNIIIVILTMKSGGYHKPLNIEKGEDHLNDEEELEDVEEIPGKKNLGISEIDLTEEEDSIDKNAKNVMKIATMLIFCGLIIIVIDLIFRTRKLNSMLQTASMKPMAHSQKISSM